MSTIAWIILLVLLIPIIGVLVFVIIMASLIRIPSGTLGLVMVRGRATDPALLPGRYFLPPLRGRMVEEYPSTELAYRAGGQDNTEDTRPDRAGAFARSGPANRFQHLDQSGPLVTVTLGDKATATVCVTVRFVLLPQQLRLVHDRFGPNGIFGVVRDETSRAVRNTLADPGFGVESLFGTAQATCQDALSVAVGKALETDGIKVGSRSPHSCWARSISAGPVRSSRPPSEPDTNWKGNRPRPRPGWHGRSTTRTYKRS